MDEQGNNANEFDLAVVGGGPAGITAAYLAARAGLRTALLEQKRYPRRKICGGLLSARAASLLPVDFRAACSGAVPVHRVELMKKTKSFSCQSEKPLGYLVRRSEFDHNLARIASKTTGLVLFEGCRLQSLETAAGPSNDRNSYILHCSSADSPLQSRFVIGADGPLSATAEQAGLAQACSFISGWAAAAIATGEPPSGVKPGTARFYPRPFEGGMGWAFYDGHFFNCGIGGLGMRRRMTARFKRLFGGEKTLEHPTLWPLPFLGPVRKPARGNLILIGDAAGLVEPFSGEGIYCALKSAHLAVQAVLKAKAESLPAEDFYMPLFQQHFRKKFIPTLLGAVALHAISLLNPSKSPELIIRFMNNELWFNNRTLIQNSDLQ